LRRADDPEDSSGLAIAMAASMNDVQAMAAEDEYGKWWSATDSGNVIDLEVGGARRQQWELLALRRQRQRRRRRLRRRHRRPRLERLRLSLQLV
jgi:hypothetical protein